MKTFELYTIAGQKLTVRNCINLQEALKKADLREIDIYKSIER